MGRLNNDRPAGLYIVLISVHGLIRGQNIELGRDADTGGQTKYVVELARALAAHKDVERVDLITRLITDPKVDADYAQQQEQIAPCAYIIRLPFGPRRYLRKETLWPHLDSMADQMLKYLRTLGRIPEIIHSHYADAGYVGARLSGLLGVPLVHTGHSLGRDKKRRLLDQGTTKESIEKHYNISRRIEAEEYAMDVASLLIASTRQEVEEQYSHYANYQPQRMQVIPPGTDLSRFHPPRGSMRDAPQRNILARFLRQPDKPMILALSRADERKNIQTLVRAFGETPPLRTLANLIIVAGNRDDISQMDKGPRKVLTELLFLIDQYDLYGEVAYPKQHQPDDVPEFYRLAARSRGVFVNPALTEPFGLTLIEAAASGLPIVATEDGGPRDIIAHCKNGLLVNPLDANAIGAALLTALSDKNRWRTWAAQGVRGAHRHYSWNAHVETYLKAVRRLITGQQRRHLSQLRASKSRLPTIEKLLVCDIDDTLLGDPSALHQLFEQLGQHDNIGFAIATGRPLENALKTLKDNHIPLPDVLISSVGSEIHYLRQRQGDFNWERHIHYRWEPQRLRQTLAQVPGLKIQPEDQQRSHKISYFLDAKKAPPFREIVRLLRRNNLSANLIYSHQAYLDVLPIRASKGQALRYLGAKWGIPPEQMLVAGGSGNDIEMLRGDTLAVVVGNHSPEVGQLRGEPLIYFAAACHAAGVLEGMAHYHFLGMPQEHQTTG